MALNRRAFVKIVSVAGASLLVSLGLQSGGVGNVSKKSEKKYIPGAGSLSKEDYEKIDSDAFIALCARCGICLNVCPFKAIKSKEIFYPTLTKGTRDKCPSYEICGLCVANCPTDALGVAFEPLGGEVGAEQTRLWNGPTLKNDREIVGQNR